MIKEIKLSNAISFISNDQVYLQNLYVHFPIYGGVFSKKIASVKAVDGISFSLSKIYEAIKPSVI